MPRNAILSSPPVDWALLKGRTAMLNALQFGPVPEHMAFIMDGNRRYAREKKLETAEGHHIGFESLANCLSLCYQAGIRCVTVYAFSIENFKRTKAEVDNLMNMAKMKLSQIVQQGDVLDHFGVRMQCFGDISLVHPEVRDVINNCIEMTKHNNSAVLNICAPYTSREEITSAIRLTVNEYTHPSASAASSSRRGPFSETRIARKVRSDRLGAVAEENQDEPDGPVGSSSVSSSTQVSVADLSSSEADGAGLKKRARATSAAIVTEQQQQPASLVGASPSTDRFPDPDSVTADTISKNMYSAGCPRLDILVRTSGVHRLSDFLLWQAHEDSELVVVDQLWPSFGFWDFYKIILEWQWKRRR